MIRFGTIASLTVLALTASLSACLSGGGGSDDAQAPSPGDPGNGAPTISGTPKPSTKIGEPYSFTPTASDPEGDSLSFSIDNLPPWASFDTSDGTLSGTPQAGDEGQYSGIVVQVSDGSAQASLPQFSVTVTQTANGSATLSWTAPTENEDGTQLTDLAGYRIYYGLSEGNYPNRVTVDNPGITTYVVENLSPDTYFFVSTAFNSSGVESQFSNVASTTVN